MKLTPLRFDLRTAIIVLVVGNLPIWVFIFFTVTRAKTIIDDSLASNFRAIAGINAAAIDHAVSGLVERVATLALNSEIRAAIKNQNASYGKSAEAIRKEIKSIESRWSSPVSPIAQQILSNPASSYLRRFVTLNPRFRRITVTDQFGGTAALNVKSIDFEQSDEDWWRNGYEDGITGRIIIEDVRFDPLTKTNVLHIVVPVVEGSPDSVIGVIGVATDISDLLPVVSGAAIGTTGRTLLIKDDGTIISGSEARSQPLKTSSRQESEPGTDLLPARQLQIPYLDDIMSALNTPGQPDFLVATAVGGQKRMVAFKRSGLSAHFPGLRWISIVEQEFSESNAAINSLNLNLLLAAMVILVITIGLSIYVSTQGRQEITQIGESANTV